MMFTVLREASGALHVPNNLFFQKLFRVSGHYERYLYEAIEGQEPQHAMPELSKGSHPGAPG